jgi:hypothetical protein
MAERTLLGLTGAAALLPLVAAAEAVPQYRLALPAVRAHEMIVAGVDLLPFVVATLADSYGHRSSLPVFAGYFTRVLSWQRVLRTLDSRFMVTVAFRIVGIWEAHCLITSHNLGNDFADVALFIIIMSSLSTPFIHSDLEFSTRCFTRILRLTCASRVTIRFVSFRYTPAHI